MSVVAGELNAQTDTVIYQLTIDREKVIIAGRESYGMTINGTIPGPTITFIEGNYAIIYVKNEMDEETSIHWHGILLPNFFDGVPYLTTPPVRPGETLKYEFQIRQAGTYWYHSHTALQEQSGVYGSIVIKSARERLEYDSDFVIVISDWTYEKPANVLRSLKRGLEWYNIRKGTAVPLNKVIASGTLGAQFNFWKQRMEGMDISDIYYPVFINNGQPKQEYPDFKPNEKVRLRIINAAASTQFWLTFGGEEALLVAADGLDVVPVMQNKTFIAVAETYDFIVTIPEEGKLEFRATAQDGSGQTSALLGTGSSILEAEDVPAPDLIAMMKQMAAMDMKMGAPALKFNPREEDPDKLMKKYGMREMEGMDLNEMQHKMNGLPNDTTERKTDHGEMNHAMRDGKNNVSDPGGKNSTEMTEPDKNGMKGGSHSLDMFADFNYDFLKSPMKTDFPEEIPVKEILLNLTGNMIRYVWSMNGVPLSEGDKIKINQGEIMRVTLNNLTMMHHPMHLHGHFFRVVNENGEYSPLKHTVNVAPMQKVIIEFNASEYGDWFFHCHILYHMDAGMARVFSYGTPRDERMKGYPLRILTNKSNHFFTWGLIDVASHMTELNIVTANIRNQFTLATEYGWNKNIESELSYERYLYDYFRVFVGVNVENEGENNLDEIEATAVAGIRYLTPYLFNLDLRFDNKLRPQIGLSREILILPRTALFGEFEYQADFGWIEDLPDLEERFLFIKKYRQEVTWNLGLEYFLSKNFTITGRYDNRFGVGGGLAVRF
jgi:CopA family copper-resistance protein